MTVVHPDEPHPLMHRPLWDVRSLAIPLQVTTQQLFSRGPKDFPIQAHQKRPMPTILQSRLISRLRWHSSRNPVNRLVMIPAEPLINGSGWEALDSGQIVRNGREAVYPKA